VHVRKVQVSGTDGELAAIASGLAVGDQVVIEGQQRLDEGTRVKASPAGSKPAPANGKQDSSKGRSRGGQKPATAVRSARG
jgi:multidrug efflux system membrane fusion protein